jgi:hypothetical protein
LGNSWKCNAASRSAAPRYRELSQYLTAEGAERLDAALNAAKAGTAFEIEIEILPANEPGGGWLLTKGEPVRDADGAIRVLRGTALDITAAHQRMRHPACDFARHMMQVAYAGTGVWLSDGSTTVMPVPVHRAATGQSLTDAQHAENRASVHRAWRLHYDDVRHSLATGFYQGWDLHPAQLVTRYAAVFSFFLDGVEAAGSRCVQSCKLRVTPRGPGA